MRLAEPWQVTQEYVPGIHGHLPGLAGQPYAARQAHSDAASATRPKDWADSFGLTDRGSWAHTKGKTTRSRPR
jgi:hypothetical protein